MDHERDLNVFIVLLQVPSCLPHLLAEDQHFEDLLRLADSICHINC